MKSLKSKIIFLFFSFILTTIAGQFVPKNLSSKEKKLAKNWVCKTYKSLSEDEKLGQLFIIALYTNKGEDYISNVRDIVEKEKIGGLILMQDNAAREIDLVNEFQQKTKVPLLIGMDAEWGLFQRIATAHKLPWAITLGAIQDKTLVSEMASKIAEDCKRMGINWDFAPVVDVNTNPLNPIIGNRSFGSEVPNVISSALAYSNGLQENNILAAIKHFPGHGDTSTDSHLDLPVVAHELPRLNAVELAPFRALLDKGIGGVMVAHLYVPALENGENIPASLSYDIVTNLLKKQYGYKGLIITDALNMGAVAKKYPPGVVDALAFKAGNDIMLFSEGVKDGKRLIKKAIDNGDISKKRLKESVKKILLTKYYLGLTDFKPQNPIGVDAALNSDEHRNLAQKLYAHALTLVQNKKDLLPLRSDQTYYLLDLEEAPSETFVNALQEQTKIVRIKKTDIAAVPVGSTVIVSIHKDNSTAYKPYTISAESRKYIAEIAKNNNVVLTVFGSPYALRDFDISQLSTVLVAYENNDDSMKAVAKSLQGEHDISGRLPVLVNENLNAGAGIDLKITAQVKN